MAGLAVLLKARGHEVDGCDLRSTPRTRWLEALGIPVAIGHDAGHVEGKDLVVVTPAVAKDNPEYLAAETRRKCRGEMLAEIVNAAPDSIAVCGSHGKTTTATFIAKLLIALGEPVEWAIGGETGSFPVAGLHSPTPPLVPTSPTPTPPSHSPHSPVLVVEADESDGTLALYRAKTLVVTNCEYDHPDHFKSREDYFACYETAKARAGAVIPGEPTNEETAVKVALARGHSSEAIAAVLPQVTAELPDRRFQRLEEGVVADYGHHPTEVAYAIARARQKCRGRLRVLFQPHRYSRTAAFLDGFATALAGADEVVICPVYAAFEQPVPNGTAADLYAVCRARGLEVRLARSCEEAWTHAKRVSGPDDLVLVQGAGDIIEHLDLLAPRRVWVGAETNLVRSDLDLPVEYVKTSGPAGRPGAGHPLLAAVFPWMAGIPGTLGGWVKMNAGAHGHAIAEVIARVKVDGRWVSAGDCGFGYRTSAIVGEIQDVEFMPVKGGGSLLSPSDYLAKRRKFPAHTRGSVFKNPEGDSAGRLLEACGCKGLRVGGAFVWEGHANVIVAPPESATASDFLALAELMRERVRLRFGVLLMPEVRGISAADMV